MLGKLHNKWSHEHDRDNDGFYLFIIANENDNANDEFYLILK